MHSAAAAGDLARLKAALEAAPRGCFLWRRDPLNAGDAEGNTPLMLAVSGNHSEVVAWLLSQGARPNRANKQGWRPLHRAAENNSLDCLQALLAAKADPNRRRRSKADTSTPLHRCARLGLLPWPQQLHLLFQRRRCIYGQACPCINPPPAHPSPCPPTQTLPHPPLHSAARQGHVEAIDLLLAARADPNVRVDGWTPLDIAARAGNTPAVQALLSAGAKPNGADKQVRGALLALPGIPVVLRFSLVAYQAGPVKHMCAWPPATAALRGALIAAAGLLQTTFSHLPAH